MRHNPVTGILEDKVHFEEIAARIKAFQAERWARWFRFVPYHPPEMIPYTEAEIAAGKSHLTASYCKEPQIIKIYLPEEGLTVDVVDEYADPTVAATFEKNWTAKGLGRFA